MFLLETFRTNPVTFAVFSVVSLKPLLWDDTTISGLLRTCKNSSCPAKVIGLQPLFATILKSFIPALQFNKAFTSPVCGSKEKALGAPFKIICIWLFKETSFMLNEINCCGELTMALFLLRKGLTQFITGSWQGGVLPKLYVTVSVTTPQVLNATISYVCVPGFKFNIDTKSPVFTSKL